ncbi:MAG: virulence factor [Immundisolibacterales bacterium]|nr:virulence factor [Immundisolibacterales bacterium]
MSSSLTVVYWRDIPAQVIARGAGRSRTARRALSGRFQEAIDRAAMRAGLAGSDDYLAEWRRSEPVPGGLDPEADADALARRLEDEFTDEVLAGMVAAGGRSSP